MENATATLWGKYKFRFEIKPTLKETALSLALAVHKKEDKTKFTKTPRAYNYIFEALQRQTVHNFRMNTDSTEQNKIDIYRAAEELHNTAAAYKIVCPGCGGAGCGKCNGHGYLIERNCYRVGITQNHTIIIDIDSHNEAKMADIKYYYETLLKTEFRIIKTRGGYWLIDIKRCANITDFVYKHGQILNPDLKKENLKEYVHALMMLDSDEKGNFKGATAEEIRKSKLFTTPYGNFDVAFTFLSIKRQRSTIRISAKRPGDKVEEVFL